jgi:hypothetical protein
MPINKEIGYTGLAAWSGQIQEDFLTEWRGAKMIKKVNEMRYNNAVVAALLTSIEQSVRTVSWQFTSDDGEDDERIVFLEEVLNSMQHSWPDHVSEALTMLAFGYSLFEIVYKRDEGGRILIDRLAIRGQDTITQWKLADNGDIEGVVQQGAPRYNLVNIPIDKLLHYRTRIEKNNPEGRSILRAAWIDYYYAKNMNQIEGVGVERDIAGLPVIHLPAGADTNESSETSDYSKAAKLVRRLRNDEEAGVVLPSDWVLELLSTGGTRTFDTDKIITRHESRMLMSALAQFLMLGQQSVGSFALSKDQTDLFTMSVNTVADNLCESFSHQAVPKILRMNGMDDTGIHMTHSPAGDIDLMALSDFLQKMAPLLTWTTQDEVWLRQAAKLPEVAPEEIDAIKDEKQAQSDAMLQAIQDKAKASKDQKPPEEQNIQDEQVQENQSIDATVEWFTAHTPAQRSTWEGRFRTLMRTFLAKQKARVLRGARGIK